MRDMSIFTGNDRQAWAEAFISGIPYAMASGMTLVETGPGHASLLLPALVGYPRAAEKLMLGEPFYAEEAVEMGLVNRLLPPGEVNAYAQAQAAKLAAKPMASLTATKALMKKGQVGLQQIMGDELKLFGALLRGPAAKEAISAVMEKRKPDFSKV